MGDTIKLAANRVIDRRMIVSMHIAPKTGNAIQQFSAIGRLQKTTLGPLDRQRLVVGHLRKTVPVAAGVRLPLGTLLLGKLVVFRHWRIGQIFNCGSLDRQKTLKRVDRFRLCQNHFGVAHGWHAKQSTNKPTPRPPPKQ